MKKLFACVFIVVFIAAALLLFPTPYVSAEKSEEPTQSIFINGLKEMLDR